MLRRLERRRRERSRCHACAELRAEGPDGGLVAGGLAAAAAKLKTAGAIGGGRGEVIGDAADGEDADGDEDEAESGVNGDAGDAALRMLLLLPLMARWSASAIAATSLPPVEQLLSRLWLVLLLLALNLRSSASGGVTAALPPGASGAR